MSTNNILDYPQSKIRNPYFSLSFAITISLSSLYFGNSLVYLSTIDFAVIAEIYSINFDLSLAQGILQGILPIGGALGALSSTYFISILSRKHIIFLFNAIATLLCFLSLIPNFNLFMLIRLLQGFTTGIFASIVPMMVREVSPLEMSSITGALPNLFITVTLFFTYFQAYILGIITGETTGIRFWKVVFLFPIAIIIVQTVLMMKIFHYETPKYLAQNNLKQDLKIILQKIYKDQYVEQLYEQTLEYYSPSNKDITTHTENNTYLSKSALIYGTFYAILQPFVGINIAFNYSSQIASKMFPSLREVVGMILMFLFFAFSTISLKFVNKYGRKQLTLWGTYGIIVSHLSISIGYFINYANEALSQKVVFFSLILFLFFYAMTYGPIMWMWLPEALQPSQIGFAVTANWSGVSLTLILFPILQAILPSQGYFFLFFALVAFLSIFVTKKFMLQTKDKKDFEIALEYRKLDQQIWGIQQTKDIEMHLIQY